MMYQKKTTRKQGISLRPHEQVAASLNSCSAVVVYFYIQLRIKILKFEEKQKRRAFLNKITNKILSKV